MVRGLHLQLSGCSLPNAYLDLVHMINAVLPLVSSDTIMAMCVVCADDCIMPAG